MFVRQARARVRRLLATGFLTTLIVIPGPVLAIDKDDFGIRIAPIRSEPGGQSYGRWAAEWWQWGLGVPAKNNPILDQTGAACAQRQVDDTWFLAGSFGSDPVVRDCVLPEGKALFFPLVNNAFFAFLSDPPETRSEAFLRAQAKCTVPLQGFVELDDLRLTERRLRRLTTGRSGSQSPIFNVQLPPGNVFGAEEDVIPELVLSPSAEEGFYLYIKPLSPGEHRIRWLVTGCTPDSRQDVTYHLTVVASDRQGGDDKDDD